MILAALLAALPETIGAQSQPGGDAPPLTERERSLLQRIQSLEKKIAGLRDVQARLAAIEARLGEERAQGTSKEPADSAAVGSYLQPAAFVPGGKEEPQPPRAAAPASPKPAPQSAAASPPSQPAGGQPPSQSSATTPPAADDKARFPEASDGNPAVFGEFNPGRGFVVSRGQYGELDLSGYMAVRYLNQLPPDQSATDHLGRPFPVEPRNDFQFHRVMLFSQGWLFSPKFQYSTFVWTVQDTNQVAVGGALYYNFSKYFTLGAGWNAYPGTLSLQGSHPYWVSYDRVMADEFFRPYFSQGVFAQGNLLRTLQYRWMVGNNNSNLDVPASKLDRDLSAGFAITWQPTTGEFGPRGAFGDYERHKKLATRFNLAYTYSPEERQSPIGTPASNTTLRLADSLNVFDTGALAAGVTVERVRYQLVSVAAGMKYRGFWLQGEGYFRKLDHFIADGPLPVAAVRNTGFYVQAAQMIVPNRIELYGSTSFVLGEFGQRPHEFIGGANYYPWNTRNLRLNLQLINVSHSPVSSTFGFYTGQITGKVLTLGFTAFY
uniref:Phosphate-selective porin O and P n=1 Tax=Solibacter usitatus (strain Ellin6076) TaxID=234267 RepID=Q01VF9_SOLUE